MRDNEIEYIDNIINDFYNKLIDLKIFIGEKKGENKAYEYNRNLLQICFKKGVESNNIGDETPMQYKNVKLRKRIDNRWEARWQRDNVKYIVYGNTQKECYEKLKANYGKNKNNIKNSKKLHEWLDYILITYKSENKSKENEIAVRVHIKPNMEDKVLSKITANDIQELLVKLKDKSRTRVTVYNLLNETFKYAIANKYIKENPCDFIKRPKHTRVTGNALTQDEEILFLQNIHGHAAEHILLFLLYSGVRRNEALTLQWEDIDWKENKIHIKGTKTEKSDRVIPIFAKLKELLKTFEIKKSGNVFEYNNPCSVTRSFIRLSGLPNHKLHDLRHTFATRCIEKNIPMKYVQYWLGHSSYKTTADIYSHISNDKLEQEFANKI